MRARIAMHDVSHLPAYVRLDIIYLRMRMQFWQGRIGSSTNRFRASFSPWTNRRVLEAMLTTNWKERDHQMLSRLFLRALHPDLSRVGVARGEPAGPTSGTLSLVCLPGSDTMQAAFRRASQEIARPPLIPASIGISFHVGRRL